MPNMQSGFLQGQALPLKLSGGIISINVRQITFDDLEEYL